MNTALIAILGAVAGGLLAGVAKGMERKYWQAKQADTLSRMAETESELFAAKTAIQGLVCIANLYHPIDPSRGRAKVAAIKAGNEVLRGNAKIEEQP